MSRWKWYRGIRVVPFLGLVSSELSVPVKEKIEKTSLLSTPPDFHYCCPYIWTCSNVVGKKSFQPFSLTFKNKSTVMRHL